MEPSVIRASREAFYGTGGGWGGAPAAPELSQGSNAPACSHLPSKGYAPLLMWVRGLLTSTATVSWGTVTHTSSRCAVAGVVSPGRAAGVAVRCWQHTLMCSDVASMRALSACTTRSCVGRTPSGGECDPSTRPWEMWSFHLRIDVVGTHRGEAERGGEGELRQQRAREPAHHVQTHPRRQLVAQLVPPAEVAATRVVGGACCGHPRCHTPTPTSPSASHHGAAHLNLSTGSV